MTKKLPKSLLVELLGAALPGAYTATQLSAVPSSEEEAEQTQRKPSKYKQSIPLIQSLLKNPDMSRQDMIATVEQKMGVTNSTAVTYYEKVAKLMGVTNSGSGPVAAEPTDNNTDDQNVDTSGEEDPQLDLEDNVYQSDNPDKQGVIRIVDDAHLVYKRQNEEGSYDELWIYNISSTSNDLAIRRNILSGTDIPPKRTSSEDGNQYYTLTTMGNAQLLLISGLSQ